MLFLHYTIKLQPFINKYVFSIFYIYCKILLQLHTKYYNNFVYTTIYIIPEKVVNLNNIKTVLCDDCKEARYLIKEYINQIAIPEIELVGETQNGYELIEFCKKNKPDLILLDIDMPFINGIETAKKIINFLPDVFFIFITAYPSFSLQAFEVHAVDYIVKPISIERLEKALRYVVKKTRNNNYANNNTITFTSNRNYYSLKPNELLFAERVGRKTLIHTPSKILEVYESLNKLQQKLNPNLFIRTHNSYLVNKSAISKIEKCIGSPSKILIKNYDKHAYLSRNKRLKMDNIQKNVFD